MALKLTKWIKQNVVSLLDPEREARIEKNVHLLHQEIATLGRKFSIATSLASQRLSGSEFDEIKERVYRRVATKAWADESLSGEEIKTLNWLGEALQLKNSAIGRIHGEFAKSCFDMAFREAIADGWLTDGEFARLDRIARSVSSTVPQLFRAYCSESSEPLFRQLFSAIVRDGEITNFEWEKLWKTAQQLGVSRDELLGYLKPQAQLFVEQVLADAKADESLSPDEDTLLSWLLQSFYLPPEFVAYVTHEVEWLRVITNAAAGRLPSLPNVYGIELRAGEILHHAEEAVYRTVRMLKSGPRVDSFTGTVYVTDSRFIFSAAERSIVLNLRSILGCIPNAYGVEIRTSAKGAGEYAFRVNPAMASLILRTAVGKANQTIVQAVADTPSRHIPREIRLRVWQTYGGRCVECKSDQYLEYDHIIPFAKGGSSAESNVQLLCRKCNLMKSDNI